MSALSGLHEFLPGVTAHSYAHLLGSTSATAAYCDIDVVSIAST
jgi:hypothetical protein